jgi:hypothetical protein
MTSPSDTKLLRSPRYNAIFASCAVAGLAFTLFAALLSQWILAAVFLVMSVASALCGLLTSVRLDDQALTERRWAEAKKTQVVPRHEIQAVVITPMPWIRPMYRLNVATPDGLKPINTLLHYRKTASVRDATTIATWAGVAVHDQTISGPAAAGWYPDPEGTGRRYWDGTAWTSQTSP